MYYLFQLLGVALVLGGSTVFAQTSVDSLVSRRVTEYLMPVAEQTHELARVPNSNFVLLSQMSPSQLVKIELDPTTEEPIAFQSFPIGKNRDSQLHGVWPSTVYPGLMWLTLQGDNQILLVDPGQTLSSAPSILQTIDIPVPGNGPHCVSEIGNRVWAGLKVPSEQDGGYYVFSFDVSHPEDQKLYPCLESPVFMSEEPTTGFIYVTQDTASSIMRINVTSDETVQLLIPPSVGSTAVGMITGYGPMSGVWFTLAGNQTGGTSTFGHIGASGEMEFFQLQQSPLGGHAGLLHVADASYMDGDPALWLLSTSLLSSQSPDALIRVTFDPSDKSISAEEYIFLPTQKAMAHRILPLNTTVLVSELHTFRLAHLAYNNSVPEQ